MALNRILGTKFKVVLGYPGTADLTLALERGETAGIGGVKYSSILANTPASRRNNLVNVLLRMLLDTHPGLQNTPTGLEAAAQMNNVVCWNSSFPKWISVACCWRRLVSQWKDGRSCDKPSTP